MTKNSTHPTADATSLLATYAHAMDDHRVDDVVALFTDEATVTLPGIDPVTGHDALRKLWGGSAARARHLFINVEVTAATDDRIETVSDVVIIGGETWSIRAVGRYTDVMVRDGNRLLFSDRRLELIP